jgi:hypothetical protein
MENRNFDHKRRIKMKKIISRKILVALVAVLAAVAMMFGLSIAASATTKSGTSAGCSYSVSDDNYRTTVTATSCSAVDPHIKYQNNATGTITDDHPGAVTDPLDYTITVYSGQVTGPVTILDNFGVFYPGREGITSFTISTRHS